MDLADIENLLLDLVEGMPSERSRAITVLARLIEAAQPKPAEETLRMAFTNPATPNVEGGGRPEADPELMQALRDSMAASAPPAGGAE